MPWVRISQQHMQILLFSKGLEGLKKHSRVSKCPGQCRRLRMAQERSENHLTGQGVSELFELHFKQVIQNQL